MKIIVRLSVGPLDIVGYVHWLIRSLDDSPKNLVYTTDGVHPEGRRLVFVGDLVDRYDAHTGRFEGATSGTSRPRSSPR